MASPMQVSLLKPEPVGSKRSILRLEKNLGVLGIFTPRRTRPKKFTKIFKTVSRLPDGTSVEATATVRTHSDFGLPITADQDKFYALLKLLNDARQREGMIRNPVRFTYREFFRVLNRKPNGDALTEVDEWLDRMHNTTVKAEGVFWLAGKKCYSSQAEHIFAKVVKHGEQLDNGDQADRCHVFLSDWIIENFEHNYVLPIDYESYRQLRLPIAKALVPLLQVWFYASRNNRKTTISKRYLDLCDLLGIERGRALSRILQTTQNSLEELQRNKLIGSWDFDRTADDRDYKLLLTPGEQFVSDRQAKLIWAPDSPEKQWVERLIYELKQKGVHERKAQELVYRATDLSLARLRVAYAEHEILRRERRKMPVDNPAGFYVWALENEVYVPKAFAEQYVAEITAETDRTREEYVTYRHLQTRRYFETYYTPEQQEELITTARIRVRKEAAPWLDLPEKCVRDLLLDQVLRDIEPEVELMSFDQFSQNKQLDLDLASGLLTLR
jgi:hypothetical protein